MSAITKEQAKDLRNAFQCWQLDYDQVADKEQYEMFGLGMVAMDALLAAMDAEPVYQYQSGIYNEDNGETDWYWDAAMQDSTVSMQQTAAESYTPPRQRW